MYIVNDRLIIDENEIRMDCIRLENIIRGYLHQIGHGDSDIEVYFDDECYNEATNHIWNNLEIELYHSNGCQSYITFSTEGYSPTLVNENGNFKFYYVFDLCSYTTTDEYTLENGHYPGMKPLEMNIWEYIKKTSCTAEVTVKITKGGQ